MLMGTPRRHEPRSPLAVAGQGERSARTVGSGVRVVCGFETRDLKEAKTLLDELAVSARLIGTPLGPPMCLWS
jgi:hypothetical protein